MEEVEVKYKFQADCSYPSICVEKMNCAYGQAMLDNFGGSNSEITAISSYLYSHLNTTCWEEISSCFRNIMIVEMQHLEIFGTLARQLGKDVRLWSRKGKKNVYWSPACHTYPREIKGILLHSIHSEKATIEKYTYQSNHICDANIVENLQRIIMDEILHVEILTDLFHRYCE